MRFDVEDSGIGIPPRVQARLFRRFAQADASTTRRFGGTGRGLSIVKHLAELMGGTVTLTSVEGVGSVFSVRLKFAIGESVPTAGEDAPLTTGPQLLGVRVLVTDDSEINLIVAGRILTLHGAIVSVARNGQEAFDLLAQTPSAFDVVLMDLQMPVLDGVRRRGGFAASSPWDGCPSLR